MSASAWLILAITWSIIVFFAAKFFLMVLRSDAADDGDEAPGAPHAP